MSETTNSAPATFDYLALESETRQFVQQKANETQGLLKRTVEHVLLIGQNLRAVKERLPHGQFLLWPQAEFGMSRWTAQRFIRVAEKLEDKWSTVHHLPLRVLYELTMPSTSEEILKEVQAGQISPTLEAVKAAKEAEQHAREEQERTQAYLVASQEEVRQKQEMIEHLSTQIAQLQDQITMLSSAPPEIKEVEKVVVPPEVKARVEQLESQVQALTRQRDQLAQQVAQLGEEARAAAIKRGEGEQARRLRLQWYQASTAFRSNVNKLLSQWPSPLDTVVFEADDWTRLSQVMDGARRVLEACKDLMQARIVESDPPSTRQEGR